MCGNTKKLLKAGCCFKQSCLIVYQTNVMSALYLFVHFKLFFLFNIDHVSNTSPISTRTFCLYQGLSPESPLSEPPQWLADQIHQLTHKHTHSTHRSPTHRQERSQTLKLMRSYALTFQLYLRNNTVCNDKCIPLQSKSFEGTEQLWEVSMC